MDGYRVGLLGWLTAWMVKVAGLDGWMFGLLYSCMVGWMYSWMAGLLDDWLVWGQMVGCWMEGGIGWLAGIPGR